MIMLSCYKQPSQVITRPLAHDKHPFHEKSKPSFLSPRWLSLPYFCQSPQFPLSTRTQGHHGNKNRLGSLLSLSNNYSTVVTSTTNSLLLSKYLVPSMFSPKRISSPSARFSLKNVHHHTSIHTLYTNNTAIHLSRRRRHRGRTTVI